MKLIGIQGIIIKEGLLKIFILSISIPISFKLAVGENSLWLVSKRRLSQALWKFNTPTFTCSQIVFYLIRGAYHWLIAHYDNKINIKNFTVIEITFAW